MNIFPNPASTECKISFAKPVTNVEIKLIDMSGDIKGYWRVNGESGQITVPLGNVTAGTYTLHAITNNGVYVKKLIVFK